MRYPPMHSTFPTPTDPCERCHLHLRLPQDEVLSTLGEWLADTACNRNATVLLMAGLIYAHEGIYEEALKICQSPNNLEL